MPPYYFDSEDTSVIGEAERTTRQFVPTNLDLQSAMGEVATSTRRTLIPMSLCDESAGSGQNGYIRPNDQFENWDEDWAAWKNLVGLPLFTISNSPQFAGRGRWQDDLNIVAAAVIKVRHTPAADDIIPALNQYWITGENGIVFFNGPTGNQPSGTEVASVYRQAGEAVGIRYPDFIFANIDESGSLGGDVQPGVDNGLLLVTTFSPNFNTYAFPVQGFADERYIEWLTDDVDEIKDTG